VKKFLLTLALIAAGPVLADTGTDTECEPSRTWPDPLPGGLSFFSGGFQWQGANPPPGLNGGFARTFGCYIEVRREPRTNQATGVGAPVLASTYYKMNFETSRIEDPMARSSEMAVWSMDFSDQIGPLPSGWLNIYVEPVTRRIIVEKLTVSREGKRDTVRNSLDYAMSDHTSPCALIQVTKAPPQLLAIRANGSREQWTVSVTCPATGVSTSVAYTFEDRTSGNLFVGRLNEFLPIGYFRFGLY
jgi:hypothetical protein